MKKLINILFFISLLSQTTLASSANVDTHLPAERELRGRVAQINKIRSEIKVDQVIYRLKSQFAEQQDEVLISERQATRVQDVVLNIMGYDIKIPGFLTQTTSTTQRVTQMQERAPELRSKFESDVQTKNLDLKAYLENYFSTHFNEIIQIKVLATEAYFLLVQLAKDKISVQSELMDALDKATQEIQFLAEHEVSVCVAKNYLPYTNGTSVTRDSIIPYLNFHQEIFREVTRVYAYSEKSCVNQVEIQKVSDKDSIFQVRLLDIEALLQSWRIAAKLAQAFTFNLKLFNNDFNSPYLK